MTFKQLEALYWSARLGSFALAAERLFMTQSALSKRIQELETEIGEQLFDRSGPRARITDAGSMILAKAKQILGLRDEIKVAAQGARKVSGTCRFGISELMAMQWLPRIVSEVRARYPDVLIEPHVAVTQELLQDVERGQTDFAICPGISPDPAIDNASLCCVGLDWVSAPGLFPKEGVRTVEQLFAHPVISMSAQAGSTIALNSLAMENGLKFRRIFASNSPEAVAAVTIAGLGIALLAKPFVERFIQSGQLVRQQVEPGLMVPDLIYYLHWRTDDAQLLPRLIREIALRIITGAQVEAPLPKADGGEPSSAID
ncbi:LysR family transcriptional regulator [Mesorhizobium loti]|nr:LysR family transcriptional regulator [Mesorhizobium loti]PLP59027.1 LysR family transcriptional regulator [Mesorhizobium loti]